MRPRSSALAREVSPVSCPVGVGGVVAMRPLLLHASSKSTGEARRRVLHIEYAATTVFGPGLELADGVRHQARLSGRLVRTSRSSAWRTRLTSVSDVNGFSSRSTLRPSCSPRLPG